MDIFKNIFSLFFLFLIFFTCKQSKEKTSYRFDNIPSWRDEFNQPIINKALWSYDIGGHGWGNNEAQYYTKDSNIRVSDGTLKIIARKEQKEGMAYTSARLVSKNKGDFLYGKIVVRAKIPEGRGSWPAIWMLPTKNKYGTWPKSGEIDIMEHVGYDPKRIHQTVHTGAYNHLVGTHKSGHHVFPHAFDFKIYSIEWTPLHISFFVDQKLLFKFSNDKKNNPSTWPFNQAFHLIFNIAVGGNWGGKKGIDENSLPYIMEIDYVRYFPLLNSK